MLLSLQPEGTGTDTISEKANHKPWQKQGKGKKKSSKSKPKKSKQPYQWKKKLTAEKNEGVGLECFGLAIKTECTYGQYAYSET